MLAELELSNGAHLDDAALYWLLGLSSLRSLSLAGCVRVTDIGLCLLGSKLTRLRELNLSCCYEVNVADKSCCVTRISSMRPHARRLPCPPVSCEINLACRAGSFRRGDIGRRTRVPPPDSSA
jgi:hypothetical protein